MIELDAAQSGVFKTIEEFVQYFSYSKREIKKFRKNNELIKLFVKDSDYHDENGYWTSQIDKTFTLGDIKQKLSQASIIDNPHSLISKLKLKFKLKRNYQTGVFEDHYFEQIGENKGDETLYTIIRQCRGDPA